MKVLFIGAGNMGQAIIGGIIRKKIIKAEDIFIYEIDPKKSGEVRSAFGVNELTSLDGGIKGFDAVILAVKPQVFRGFASDEKMKGLGRPQGRGTLVISIMAGITLKGLEAFFGNGTPIVRIMPNTPAMIGEAVSAVSPNANVTKEELGTVTDIFGAVGRVEKIDEKLLDAVTGLSGSGPAYVFSFIEALTEGGVECGLDKRTAERLAVQTLIGASKMVSEKDPPEELRRRVTSPAGTTMEGLAALDKLGFRKAVVEAVRAAARRSKELSSSD